MSKSALKTKEEYVCECGTACSRNDALICHRRDHCPLRNNNHPVSFALTDKDQDIVLPPRDSR